MAVGRATVRVSKIPLTALAKDLFDFFEAILGKGSVYACEIATERKNWKSRGFGRVQFETIDAKNTINLISEQHKLVFKGTHLEISPSVEEIIIRPVESRNRVKNGVLHVGYLVGEHRMNVLESWKGVKAEIMPERGKIEFWVVEGVECYRLEVQFGDIMASSGYRLGGKEPNALLVELRYAPKIYQKIYGPTLASKFSNDRYHICKENFEFVWVRTTDFSVLKSIGQSSSLCWDLKEGLLTSDILSSFPCYREEVGNLILEQEDQLDCKSELVPLINCQEDSKLAYEIIFQLNSLIHTNKISLKSVDAELIDLLSELTTETADMILQELHKKLSTCFEPMSFIQSQLSSSRRKRKSISSSQSKLRKDHIMSCHRVFITPSKIYCMGPELENSNYVVRHYAAYASNFVRVTFVEEDWTKLPSDAISAIIEQGIFSKPYRTRIYHRVLSILRDGIKIGSKRFEFLAFSASQLRSNSVWMFASNDSLRAEDIREWMGNFNRIRSVSKCAARMGQLFSSSKETLNVSPQDVEIIPDIEVTTDGIQHCFSDGIGKVSLSFGKEIALECGLEQGRTPSAFQIRYGGYKGVIAVDRSSFRKLSLRLSMSKFHSEDRMLNITSWSESMPCYLNREIISLLSTLGIEDEKFEKMQHEQIRLLDEMLTNREAALGSLACMGKDCNTVLTEMLLNGYEPSVEPFLSMMLIAHREHQLSDLRSKCRIFVPKGRILMGCLDETGMLDYGQVYVRVTMTEAEKRSDDHGFFQKVRQTKTSIVMGRVVVTKNPCLHPGDIRVLQAVYEEALEEKGLVDCLVFPQKGERPHPNECSGGDLDGDLYFVCWDENLIPSKADAPMDYIARRPRLMDHEVTLEEIQRFFVDYMINDTLGVISTAHLIHADRDPAKARSPKCLQLATLHSMAVDFAKTGAPAEMPRVLKPKEYPDFLERGDRPMYISRGILGKLYRATHDSTHNHELNVVRSEKVTQSFYDHDLEVEGYEDFLEIAGGHKKLYADKLSALMNYYGAESEDEILTGNLRNRSAFLQRDKRRYGEMKDRILISVGSLHKEAKGWFRSSCKEHEHKKMASAWYHVSYHPDYCQDGVNYLSFPWILDKILLEIKSEKKLSTREVLARKTPSEPVPEPATDVYDAPALKDATNATTVPCTNA
ncbi:RNA-dependent RNA polymerase 2 [Macadamia integrifolia]|uniref:RNA-dependent RNA polymerase 2 n=1 Tax=Macadamia integrifolia TaxID=60698 RepID=UPI001C4F2244|nr:RNA-dependent RNA polymerase 2 [Macadamia integrifolia]